jgi:acetamidase/formamidase
MCPTEPVHFTWDDRNEPILTIDSGDTVVVQTRDVSDNQVGPDSTVDVLGKLDWNRVYPLAGPIWVNGAEPGDTLAVEIAAIQTGHWGWTAVLPGFGLLADRFREPYLRVFRMTGGAEFAYMREDVAIPVEPFFGTMGVCPAGARQQSVMPPGRFGGNLDTRQLTQGTTLYLPVQVNGALFSCGDAHAAQGDGEVCVTGIEAPCQASLRFTLVKGRSIPSPQFLTSGPLAPRNKGPHFGTTGIGPDLYRAAQEALDAMVDHIAERYRMTPVDAYVLSSLCVDLKISEIVDAGQYVVSAVLPLSVFRQ